MSISKSLNDFYKKQGRLVGADGDTIHTMSFGEIIKPEGFKMSDKQKEEAKVEINKIIESESKQFISKLFE